VSDVSVFLDALEKLVSLKSFTLRLNNNKIATGIDEIYIGIDEEIANTAAFCPFYFDISLN
jgi:hypothetical protein